jgi:hypothetical protein
MSGPRKVGDKSVQEDKKSLQEDKKRENWQQASYREYQSFNDVAGSFSAAGPFSTTGPFPAPGLFSAARPSAATRSSPARPDQSIYEDVLGTTLALELQKFRKMNPPKFSLKAKDWSSYPDSILQKTKELGAVSPLSGLYFAEPGSGDTSAKMFVEKLYEDQGRRRTIAKFQNSKKTLLALIKVKIRENDVTFVALSGVSDLSLAGRDIEQEKQLLDSEINVIKREKEAGLDELKRQISELSKSANHYKAKLAKSEVLLLLNKWRLAQSEEERSAKLNEIMAVVSADKQADKDKSAIDNVRKLIRLEQEKRTIWLPIHELDQQIAAKIKMREALAGKKSDLAAATAVLDMLTTFAGAYPSSESSHKYVVIKDFNLQFNSAIEAITKAIMPLSSTAEYDAHKQCAEKSYTSTLIKLYNLLGKDLRVEWVSTITLPYLKGKASEVYRPAMQIPCCVQCQRNKDSLLILFDRAQRWWQPPAQKGRTLEELLSDGASDQLLALHQLSPMRLRRRPGGSVQELKSDNGDGQCPAGARGRRVRPQSCRTLFVAGPTQKLEPIASASSAMTSELALLASPATSELASPASSSATSELASPMLGLASPASSSATSELASPMLGLASPASSSVTSELASPMLGLASPASSSVTSELASPMLGLASPASPELEKIPSQFRCRL